MADDHGASYACSSCGTTVEAPGPVAAGEGDAPVQCPSCGSTAVTPFQPHAAPYPHQPNPELLHLQHLTPRAPLAPGAMVGMGPYLPVPEPNLPPARWAEDPMGRHEWRWWSGAGWTDHVADDGVAATDPIDLT